MSLDFAADAMGIVLIGSMLATLFVMGLSRIRPLPGAVWLVPPAVLQIAGMSWVVKMHAAALDASRQAPPEAAQAVLSDGLALAMNGSGSMYWASALSLALSAVWLLGPGRAPERPRGPHRIFIAVLVWQALAVSMYARLARALGAMFIEAATSPPEIRMQLTLGATGSMPFQRTVTWAVGAALVAAVAAWSIKTRRDEFEGAGVWLRATAVVGVLAAISLSRLISQQLILANFAL
ncbi:MAG: hypothetical protein GY898_12690 [Proteobacteria bacterium]|nr:hypothetical protein [Pseudomonadota bacterium]